MRQAGSDPPLQLAAPPLAELLRQHRHEILDFWQRRARELICAGGSPEDAFVEHLPCLVDRLADTVEAMARGTWKATSLDGAELRAVGRLAEAIDDRQLLSRLSLLRSVVLELAWKRQPERGLEELQLLGRALDETVSQLVEACGVIREQMVRALDSISCIALSSRGLDELLPQLLRVVLDSAGDVDTLALLLLDGDTLQLRAAVGLENKVEIGFHLKVGEGFAGRIAAERAPLALRADSDDPLMKSPALRRLGVRALYGVPLVANGDVLGVLHMGSLSAPEFTEQGKRLLRAIADRAAVAIRHQKLQDATERLVARTAQVQAITAGFVATLKMPEVARVILDQGRRLLDAASGSVAIVVGEEFELIATDGYGPEGSSRQEMLAPFLRCSRDVSAPTADAVRDGAPVWIESKEEFLRRYPALALYPSNLGHGAWAGLPLVLDGRPIGVIGLSFTRERRFLPEEKAFAVELAQLCAQALGRAQLHQEVEAARARAEELVQSRDQALAVLDSMYDTAPVGLAFLDRELRYVRINEALAQLNGFPAAAHLGKRISEVLSQVAIVLDPHGAEDAMRRVLESGEPRLDIELSGELSATPGVQRCWLNSWYPVRVAGQIVGLGIVVCEITEQKRAAEERTELIRAQAARAEAQAATRATNDFLAVLSHELRTPLQSMLGWTQLLKEQRRDERLMEKGLATIERNAKLQTHLIEDLLDVSRILTGKLSLERRRVDLAGVVGSALESVKAVADAKSIQLDAAIAPPEAEVLGDPDRLQQIVSNLLSNALKFTPRGGRVCVRLERAGAAVRVLIEDTGCGIAPEFLPHVFDRFRQANSSTTRSQGGLGLGLAIVRHLVEMHDGTVKAESPGDGRGATFTVTLPLVRAEPKVRSDGLGKSAWSSASKGALLAGVRVLVVDDDPDSCELLEAVLSGRGAEVRAASSARAALDEIASFRPHLLVSDIGMAEEDGYTLLRQVRAREAALGGHVPAIALTAFASAADREQALAAGFEAHLTKPTSPDELVRKVASVLGRTA